MKLGTMMAGAAVGATVLVGGAYALAPALQGQVVSVERGRSFDGDLLMPGVGQPSIGIGVREVEKDDLAAKKLSAQTGAVVEDVREGTPAAKAGVKAGDVVVAFDGESVRGARHLERLVEETPEGRTVKMAVLRDGSRVDLQVTPESQPLAFHRAFSTPAWTAREGDVEKEILKDKLKDVDKEAHKEAFKAIEKMRADRDFAFSVPAMERLDAGTFVFATRRGVLGVSVNEVSDQLAKYFGVESGVLVEDVRADTPAAKAGLKAGDVITAVNGKTVKDAGDIAEAIGDGDEARDVTIAVMRDRKPMSVTAKIEAPESKPRRTIRRTM